ncbi:hypothetical protein SKAU_G00087710 [Synaphobranchus kaupii]|uniref:DDE Tnp4 domain-containing protein n=1 Tax=Synaphobranchus kaupii TaxID=118154 RepID=A0A9Q1FWW4_SYNKA|nr:hypothetical protein SKAU_G00087710 [Synaphobranchus kaupii]
MEYMFRVSRHSISKIVLETSKALYKSLQPDYLKVPSTADEWQKLAKAFKDRRTSENAFGILATRWRLFRKPIALHPTKVKELTKAACALHNFLRTETLSRQIYTPCSLIDQEDVVTGQVTEGAWRGEPEALLAPIRADHDRNPTAVAKRVKEEFKTHFLTNGAVNWQDRVLLTHANTEEK